MQILGALTLLVLAVACSSKDGDGGGAVDCRQKADADNNPDCAAHGANARKLDCDSEAQANAAVAAGCVLEKAGGTDVCCPTSVTGKTESTLPCTEPADTLTDSDCAGTAQGRKLDCTSADQQQQGIGLGCRAESPSDPTDFDLCCPTSVRGGG
ncbi:MAG: hypothetical protein U0263_21455 [Polyangiaceae bacterium]